MGDEKVPLLDPKTEQQNGYHVEVCVTIGDLSWKGRDEGFEREEDDGDGDGDPAQMQKAVDLFSNVPASGNYPL